ncbi:hypothetical protein YC2023_018854 [Brassica napus]
MQTRSGEHQNLPQNNSSERPAQAQSREPPTRFATQHAKAPASPSLTQPSAAINFGALLTNKKIKMYKDLPPHTKSILDYVIRQIGSDLILYKPLINRIHTYMKSKTKKDKDHSPLDLSSSQNEKKKRKQSLRIFRTQSIPLHGAKCIGKGVLKLKSIKNRDSITLASREKAAKTSKKRNSWFPIDD